jgi:protein-tyrosine-phosphatase
MEVVLEDTVVAGRARMHAALGEPVRLAIVDYLTLADASPTELSARFQLASNLVAHHLNVLADACLIRRVRSEGDKRRHYVQLRLDDPTVAAVTPPPAKVRDLSTPARVVFVCTANSARSQLAAAAWRRVSALPVTSAGTHPAERIHPIAITVGRHHGLDLSAASPSPLTDVASHDDLLVAVCDNAHEELLKVETPSALRRGSPTHPLGRPRPRRRNVCRPLHWHIADPVRTGTPDAFETAYSEITQRVARLAAVLDAPA